MMDWTDRHCRYLLRLISRHARLYTEMVISAALVHGDAERHLRHDDSEQPLALQLGGSDPTELARAARLGEAAGYAEINLNVGCPSDRVQSGRFGACLMAEPALVADCVAAMREAVAVPVTVKTRIGIDEADDYAGLAGFVETVAAAGCEVFIVHARKAWLQGLSPKQNREVPPLRHDRVYRLKQDFPELCIVLNGGLEDLDACAAALERLDGVMLGRAAYHTPYLLAGVDERFFGAQQAPQSELEVARAYARYMDARLAEGVPLSRMSRHLVGLFAGRPGARRWRRTLSEGGVRAARGSALVEEALRCVTEPARESAQAARA
jgi:tRNA-dihydrouridine synthase A